MNEVVFFTPDLSTELPLMYVNGGVRAGFPSPAQDYVDGTLDLNRVLVEHPAATFYARVVGDSMEPAMSPDDIVVIDRSLEVTDQCIAVCCVNSEFTIKRIDLSQKAQGKILLVPNNPNYPTIEVQEEEQLVIWGVVRYVIHKTI